MSAMTRPVAARGLTRQVRLDPSRRTLPRDDALPVWLCLQSRKLQLSGPGLPLWEEHILLAGTPPYPWSIQPEPTGMT